MIALPPVSWRALRAWQRNRDAFLRLWKTDAIPALAEPIVVLLIVSFGFGRIVEDVDGMLYRDYVGPGMLAAYTMFAPAFENTWASYLRMAVQRTFDAMIVTPLSIEDVIAGEILWGITRALMHGVIILIVLAALGVVHSPLAVLVIPLALLQGLLMASLAMCVTARAPSINSFNYFWSLFLYPMFFLSGVFFPLHEFPVALERLAWALPMTSGVHIARNLVHGDLTLSMLWAALAMAGGAFVLFYAALALMRRRLIV